MADTNETSLDSESTSTTKTEASFSSPPSALQYVFSGAEGLRAGWGLLIFIALIVGSFYSIHWAQTAIERYNLATTASQGVKGGEVPSKSGSEATSQRSVDASKPLPPRTAFAREGPSLLAVILATFIMARIERRPFSVFGLSEYHCTSRFFAGFFWGVVCLSLLVSLLHLLGFLQFDGLLLSASGAVRYGILWAIGFLLVALLEETLFRGYVQYTLARGFSGIYGVIFKNTRHRHALGFWTAALLLSFVFGLGHSTNPGESPIGLLGAGLASLVFCFSLYRTGSLWWAIGLHAAWDWSQSFLYGVADSGLMAEGHLFATHPVGKPILSGGLTGPEGSIFAILMLIAIAGIIVVTLRSSRGGYGASNIQL